MFSNIFLHYLNIYSRVKSVFFVVLPVQQQQNGRLCKHEIMKNAFPLTGFVCRSAHVTFDGSGGIRSTGRTGVALPMCFPGQVSGRDFSEGEVM